LVKFGDVTAFDMKLLKAELTCKPRRGIRIKLHDLAKYDGYVALKRATKDIKGWKHDVINLLHSRTLKQDY